LLTRVATADANSPKAALITLVTIPEYSPVVGAMRAAQQVNPADAEIAYTLSMMERLRAAHTPA
jgi:hypothetical protein